MAERLRTARAGEELRRDKERDLLLKKCLREVLAPAARPSSPLGMESGLRCPMLALHLLHSPEGLLG